MLVGGALVSRGGLVADDRRPRIKGQSLQASIDDRAVPSRAAHHRRPHVKARLESLVRLAVVLAVLPKIGVNENVGAALQFGIDAARRLELEAVGAGGRAMPWRANGSNRRVGPPPK